MVYVVQEQNNKNILPAEKFGEIKVLLPPGSQVTFSSGQVCKKLMFELSTFKDGDYLLLIGDPVAIGIAVAVACHWNQGKCNLLKWDRMEKIYFPVSINLYEKGETDGNKEKEKIG